MPRLMAGGSSSLVRPPVAQAGWSPGQPSPEEINLFTTLAAYADALDALPLDLTRSFSDLRELDAVLGAHLNSLTNRLIHLTALVEDSNFSAGERILALKEVAEEARAYKMGGEDKIRVALNTAETIISHTTYIDTLLANLGSVPSLAALLNPPTQSHVAGHLSDGTALAPGSGPGGNNPANLSAFTEIITPSNKRKRPAGVGQGASATSGLTGSVGGSGNTVDRKGGQDAGTSVHAAATPVIKKRKPPGQGAGVKAKSQASQAANSVAIASTGVTVPLTGMNDGLENEAFKKPIVKRKTTKDEEIDESNARGRPARGKGNNERGSGSEGEEGESEVDSSTGGAAARPARVSRAPRPGNQEADSQVLPTPTLGEDADERRYCFCNNVSYGDMIGCDDDDCEREWFHLGCVGMLKPPQGTWYCNDCEQKRSSRNSKAKKAKVTKGNGGGVSDTKARVVSGAKR
ncbi:hypothetical protein CBS101457_006020 [Exobasidium rhododendri]|nr:hypothetical protein CBS101457_006020 [Exobasidium rhododendri]